MITLRIDPEDEQAVEAAAKNLGISKSEFVRESIAEYLASQEQPDAWEIGKDLFGKHSSGDGNLSSKRKELVKEKIRQKKK